MKLNIAKLLMTNGPEDLVQTYHMTKDAAEFCSNLKGIEVSYILQLIRAAKIYAAIHEADNDSIEETESL